MESCRAGLSGSRAFVGYFARVNLCPFSLRLGLNNTVMFLSFRTDRSGQTMQTQFRLQSDQGLHCLPFRLHRLDSLLYGRAT